MEDPAGWPTQTCRSVRERSKTGAIMNSLNVSLGDFGLTEKYFIPHLVLECKIYFVSFDNTTSFCFLLIPLDQSGALNTVPQILLQNFPHSQFHGINHSWISFFFLNHGTIFLFSPYFSFMLLSSQYQILIFPHLSLMGSFSQGYIYSLKFQLQFMEENYKLQPCTFGYKSSSRLWSICPIFCKLIPLEELFFISDMSYIRAPLMCSSLQRYQLFPE